MRIVTFPIRISEDESETLKRIFPTRAISPTLREIIQSLIYDTPIPWDISDDTRQSIMKTKDKIGIMKKEQERQDFVKSELFRFLSEKRIPVIYARNGQAKAKKACFELIPAFRERGHLLPECFVKSLINEYLRWIVASGEVAEQYREAQKIQEGAA